MSAGPPGPPGLARRALEWAARRLELPDLPEDAAELYRSKVRRRGAAKARAWYRRQARGAVATALAATGVMGPSGRPERGRGRNAHVGRALALGIRRLRRAPGPGLTFGLVVGVGIAAAAFMAQTRRSMLGPDLGLGRDVHVASWVDSTGLERRTLELASGATWLDAVHPSVALVVPFWPRSAVLETPQGLLRASGQAVRPGAFEGVGAQLFRGVDLAEPRQIVLSHRLWAERWGAGADPLGAVVAVDGEAYQVVGVAAPGFDGPLCCVPPDFWLTREAITGPAIVALVDVRDVGSARGWLDEVVVAGAARAVLREAEAQPFGGETGIVGRIMTVLSALAWVTWLATVLSGANIVLTSTLFRGRELRVRRALGSRPSHTVVGALAETALLAGLAAIVALGTSWAFTRIAPWLLPMVGARSSVDLDFGRAGLLAVGAATVLTTFACAAPAAAVALALSRSDRVDRGPPRSRFASSGLVVQVALAGLLLVVTGLFTETIRSLDGDVVGFRHGGTAAHFVSGGEGAPSARALVAAVTAQQRGASVALTRRLPVYGARFDSLALPDGRRIDAAHEVVTEGFFETVGTNLVLGRSARDDTEAVVSGDLAVELAGTPFGAVGRAVSFSDGQVLRVVGVVEAASWGSGRVRPTVYRGWGSEPVQAATLLARAEDGRGLPAGPLLAVLRPYGLALQPFDTLSGLLVRSRVLTVFMARLARVFGALALLVALGGIHAHFLHWVRSRSRAMSVRAALGAPLRHMAREILGSALVLVLPGLVLGCGAGWLATRAIAGLIGLTDGPGPGLYGAVALAVLTTTALGLLAPIARARRADPLSLLRAE